MRGMSVLQNFSMFQQHHRLQVHRVKAVPLSICRFSHAECRSVFSGGLNNSIGACQCAAIKRILVVSCAKHKIMVSGYKVHFDPEQLSSTVSEVEPGEDTTGGEKSLSRSSRLFKRSKLPSESAAEKNRGSFRRIWRSRELPVETKGHESDVVGASNASLMKPTKKIRQSKELKREMKIDKFGHLRSPRASRELALCILYAAFVADVSPVKVFYDRMKQRAGWEFEKDILENYSHSPADVGENETEEDEAKAVALMEQQEEEATLEAAVLTAPLPLIYNRHVLDLAKSLLKETSERWQQQETVLLDLLPAKWKTKPVGAKLPYCILQLALTELEATETSPKIVINEAVELTKRFCDGTAPRVVNGCLGKYLKNREASKKELAPVSQ